MQSLGSQPPDNDEAEHQESDEPQRAEVEVFVDEALDGVTEDLDQS
jgi:hypothetical protein